MLAPGTRLGPYEVLSQIGVGGMGEVYRARDTRLDRLVALKIGAERFSERFEREARTIAALSHPHICTLYDVGPNYLVMELVEGQPLAGPLPLVTAVQMAAQILAALDAAHRKGITHRDLKPANILVTAQGVKLLDFGLAKLGRVEPAGVGSDPGLLTAASPTMAALTGEHVIVGTVQYMSPEQAQGKPVDARSDIFSFGLVLYEMLTGRRAFDGANPASVIAAILERDPPSLRGTVPAAVERVVERCLAKDPDERWQSARDVRHALELAAHAEAPRPQPSLRRLAIAGIAGFVVASLIGALFWVRPGPAVEPRALSVQLTPPPGAEFQFSPNGGGSVISPDGRSVAFVAVRDGIPRLWVRSLDSLAARELADTDEARLPFWSPDGSAIGFFTSSDLRRIGVSGGPAVVVARANDPRGGTWGADGAIVFSPNSVGPLYLVTPGGVPRQLTTLADGEANHRWPEFLPDGRTFLYFAFAEGRSPATYMTTVDLPGETTHVLDSTSHATYAPGDGSSEGSLLWVVRNTIMSQAFDPGTAQLTGAPSTIAGTDDVAAFSATNRSSVSTSRDGSLLYSTGGSRYQLAWFDRNGTRRETVGAIDQYIGVGVSPDGREALVTIRDDATPDGDLWRVDLATGARNRVTSEGGGYWAVWGPDSRQIAFTSLADRQVLKTLNTRGAGTVQTLLKSDVYIYPSDWSPDDTLIFTVNDQDTSHDIWTLSLTPERTTVPLMRSRFGERHAQFSPDGRWLAFTSNEADRDDVYIQSFPDSDSRRLVSSGGGAYPRWSASGRELFYRSPEGRLMMISVRVADSGVEVGTPSIVMPLVDAAGVHPYPYDVGPDGRILAMTPPLGDRTGVLLTLRTNWRRASVP